MEKTRKVGAPQAARHPTNPQGWQRLMGALLERARSLGVNVSLMEEAYVKGNHETFLRRRSILSLADIDREYPTR